MNKKILFCLILIMLPFYSTVKAQQSYVDDVDFIHYIQYEIGKCVKNMKQITSSSSKMHDIIMDECSKIITNANRLGKIEFVYKNANNDSFEKTIENCSENLRTKDFVNCVYKND